VDILSHEKEGNVCGDTHSYSNINQRDEPSLCCRASPPGGEFLVTEAPDWRPNVGVIDHVATNSFRFGTVLPLGLNFVLQIDYQTGGGWL
jgi:hypothetical protein